MTKIISLIYFTQIINLKSKLIIMNFLKIKWQMNPLKNKIKIIKLENKEKEEPKNLKKQSLKNFRVN